MAKGTTPGREQIIRRMWKLANAGVEDAVKLACFPTEEWGGVEGMNLDALTEFKRGSNGVVELKFTDRARLLERLRKYYRLPDDWSDEEARAVIGIRYELRLRGLAEELPNYVFLEDASDDVRFAMLELNVPGMQVEASVEREYYTEYAAHILGYTGKMTPEQWETYKDKGYSMDADVGQAGLEEALEEYLHGTDGERIDVVTIDGTIIKSYYTVEPKAGDNVELTIDLDLQQAAEDALAATITRMTGEDGDETRGGAVAVVQVGTGEVLALASYPTYDLSTFRQSSIYAALYNDPARPFTNRATNGTYVPGSTIKPVAVYAPAIELGLITPATVLDDTPYSFTDTATWPKNLDSTYRGLVSVKEAVAESLNTIPVKLVAQMTPEEVDRLMRFDGIVRNRLKITAAINNAKLFRAIQKEFGSFYEYVLSFFPGRQPIVNDFKSLSQIPATSPESDAMSRDMKKRGFKFFGSTICYAFLQATGFVNDHLTGCRCKGGRQQTAP